MEEDIKYEDKGFGLLILIGVMIGFIALCSLSTVIYVRFKIKEANIKKIENLK